MFRLLCDFLVRAKVLNIRPFVQVILASIKQTPEQWAWGGITLDHSSGVEIWVSTSGALFCKIWRPEKINLTAVEKILLHSAALKLAKQKTLEEKEKELQKQRSKEALIVQKLMGE